MKRKFHLIYLSALFLLGTVLPFPAAALLCITLIEHVVSEAVYLLSFFGFFILTPLFVVTFVILERRNRELKGRVAFIWKIVGAFFLSLVVISSFFVVASSVNSLLSFFSDYISVFSTLAGVLLFFGLLSTLGKLVSWIAFPRSRMTADTWRRVFWGALVLVSLPALIFSVFLLVVELEIAFAQSSLPDTTLDLNFPSCPQFSVEGEIAKIAIGLAFLFVGAFVLRFILLRYGSKISS